MSTRKPKQSPESMMHPLDEQLRLMIVDVQPKRPEPPARTWHVAQVVLPPKEKTRLH